MVFSLFDQMIPVRVSSEPSEFGREVGASADVINERGEPSEGDTNIADVGGFAGVTVDGSGSVSSRRVGLTNRSDAIPGLAR